MRGSLPSLATCAAPINDHCLPTLVGPQEAKRMCREVVGIMRVLKEQRDMSLNEVRLTVAIEDPRARERRLMGMEVRSGQPCLPGCRGPQVPRRCGTAVALPHPPCRTAAASRVTRWPRP